MIELISGFTAWLMSTHFFAGLSGALVRYSTSPHKSASEAIVGGVAGAVTAQYATPVIANILSIPESGSQSLGIAFVLGLVGLYLAEALVRIAQKYSKNPVVPTSFTPVGILDAYQKSVEETDNKNIEESNNDGRRKE